MFKRIAATALAMLISYQAQASLISLDEGFDDITTLAAAGWVTTNNSSPPGTTGWFQGNAGVFGAYDGASDAYIAANFLNADLGGTVSNWLITPELTLTSAGAVFTFFTRSSGFLPDYLEVRYSFSATENGTSTDVGSTSSSVGAFGGVVDSIGSGGYPTDWQGFSYTASGAGYLRIAFRYVVPDTFSEGDYIGIDRVQWVQNVPEPASLGMLAFGLAGIAIARRRRPNTRPA